MPREQRWAVYHRASEIAASDAQVERDPAIQEHLYLVAARHEIKALGAIPPDAHRTRGITALRAVSLLLSADKIEEAYKLADRVNVDRNIEEHFKAQVELTLYEWRRRH